MRRQSCRTWAATRYYVGVGIERSRSVLIKACLNGSRKAGELPALPLSLEASDVEAAIEAVRTACPNVPIGASTGAWIEPGAELRVTLIRAWRLLPLGTIGG